MSKSSGIVISIIFPLIFHRGQAINCFQAWSSRQTYPRDKYELIVMSDGTEPWLENEIRKLLLPQDQIVVAPVEINPVELYDKGVQRARGEWIIFTESHSNGQPQCIEELIKYVTETGMDGAACKSEDVNLSNIAKMEENMYVDVAKIRFDADHWYRIFLRGCIVRRSCYDACGGLRPEYGLFAEPLLSYHLHKQGYRFGVTKKAVVKHYNTFTLTQAIACISDYTRGESKFFYENPEVFKEAYFTRPGNWQEQGWLDNRMNRHLWTALGKSLAGSPRGWLYRLRNWLRLTPYIAIGSQWQYVKTNLVFHLYALQCRLLSWNEHLLWKVYSRLISDCLMNRVQYRFLLGQQNHAVDKRADLRLDEPVSVVNLHEQHISGFYQEENFDNISFRWTRPDMAVKLGFAPGNYILKLRVGPFRHRPKSLTAWLNGRKIKGCKFVSNEELHIPIIETDCDTSHSQYLVVCAQPFKPAKYGVPDTRELGLVLSTLCLSALPS